MCNLENKLQINPSYGTIEVNEQQTNNRYSVQHNKKEICCLAIWLYEWLLNKSCDQAIIFKPNKCYLKIGGKAKEREMDKWKAKMNWAKKIN